MLPAGTGQDDSETINSEVMLVFRKKSRGQVIGAELQEGLTHIGTAMSEAGRLAVEQLGPRVEAAREAATPAYEAAQKAVAPKVAAAVAVAAPAVASAKESVASARDTLAPRVEAARDAAAPRVAAAVLAAQKAAHDLAPHVESAQKTLKDDVVPRLNAAQVAALAYATPRVSAARDAVTPALESARETLVAGVESARSEIDARRAELVAGAEKSTRKARKSAKKARKVAGKKRQEFEKKAAATAKQVKRRTDLLGERGELVAGHRGCPAHLSRYRPHVADGLDDVAGPGFALGADHRGALADAAERFAQVPAAAHEGGLELVLVDVELFVRGGEHFALVDEVDAQRLQDLRLHEVADAGLGHDRDLVVPLFERLDDLANDLGVRHPRHAFQLLCVKEIG